MKIKDIEAFEVMDRVKKAKESPNFFAIEMVDGEVLVTYRHSYVGEPNAFHYNTVEL